MGRVCSSRHLFVPCRNVTSRRHASRLVSLQHGIGHFGFADASCCCDRSVQEMSFSWLSDMCGRNDVPSLVTKTNIIRSRMGPSINPPHTWSQGSECLVRRHEIVSGFLFFSVTRESCLRRWPHRCMSKKEDGLLIHGERKYKEVWAFQPPLSSSR